MEFLLNIKNILITGKNISGLPFETTYFGQDFT
jgi:hypothetical protein